MVATASCTPRPSTLEIAPVITKDEALRIEYLSLPLNEYQHVRSLFPKLSSKELQALCETKLLILYLASKQNYQIPDSELSAAAQALLSKDAPLPSFEWLARLLKDSDLPQDKQAFSKKIEELRAQVKIQVGSVFLSENR